MLVDEDTLKRILEYVESRKRGRKKIDVDPLHLKKLLTRYNGNKRAVARTLGISPTTLYKLLRKHNLIN